MAIEIGAGASGVSGITIPIDSVLPMNYIDNVLEINTQTWLKSGFTSNISTYPDAYRTITSAERQSSGYNNTLLDSWSRSQGTASVSYDAAHNGTDIYIINWTDNTVEKYSITGALLGTTDISTHSNNPLAICSTATSIYIWGSTLSKITEYDLDMNFVRVVVANTGADPSNARSMTTDGVDIVISEVSNGQLFKYAISDGSFGGVFFDFSLTSSGDPRGITYDGKYYWVVALGTDDIFKFNSDGSYTGEKLTITGGGDRYIFSFGDKFYVGDRVANTVSVYANSPSGALDYVGLLAAKTDTDSGLPLYIKVANFIVSILTFLNPTEQKVQGSDTTTGDLFGYAVAISKDGATAVVGARVAGSTGMAYVFIKSGGSWVEQQKIEATNKSATDLFGTSVAISGNGNTVIIGAEEQDTGGTDVGSSYVFTRSGVTWTEEQIIQSDDPQAGDFFGRSVAISEDGNTAVVGAAGEDTGGSNAGAAYMFTRSGVTWTQQQKVQASDKEADDGFGIDVDISDDGNTAIVGASLEDTGGLSTGAVYVFTRSGATWTEEQKIQASDPQANDFFGSAIAISGDSNTILSGSWGEDTTGASAGAAYFYTRSGTTWTEEQKIQSSDIESLDHFGDSVTLSTDGSTAVIGSDDEDTGGSATGAAYVWKRTGTTWAEVKKIQASDLETLDHFGYSVSISGNGNNILVGAIDEGTGGVSAGAVYAYDAT